MSRNVKVVIGAGYGDEGKGLMTDYFANELLDIDGDGNVINYRFNGGSQAGHTVHRDGLRHEFSHFGSASLLGVPTYLGKEFVCNPMRFRQEWIELIILNPKLDLQVYVNEKSMMTIPFDIMINQIVETHRGVDRHGSCGMGFAETIQRHQTTAIGTPVSYFKSHGSNPAHRFKKIRKYALHRLQSLLKLQSVDEVEKTIDKTAYNNLFNDDIVARYIEDLKFFFEHVKVVKKIPTQFKSVVCEGAQGLQLHQYGGNFPYVTRSNTGIENVINDGEFDLEKDDLEVLYVSRCYQTKHGAGPFEHEVADLRDINVVDPTNVPNEFQGTLRFAPLDVSKLLGRILTDIIPHKIPLSNVSVAFTCIDQIKNETFQIIAQDKHHTVRPESFCNLMNDMTKVLGLRNIYYSIGNSANDVNEFGE